MLNLDRTVSKLHLIALMQNLKTATYVHKGIFLSGKERRKKESQAGRQGGTEGGREGGGGKS